MPDFRPQNTHERLDAVIVGAGVIGLACAWRAAKSGLRVRVIERAEPGSGASGVAAGMLAPVGEATWGEEQLLDAALASHRMWADFADELADAGQAESSLLESGALHVALDADEAGELRRRFDLMRSLGLEADWLTGRECRELEPGLGPSAFAGVHAPHEAGVDPAAIVSALRRACLNEGTEIVTGATVTGAVWDGDAIRGVVTEDGAEHRAQATVLAAGAWSGSVSWLPEGAVPPVRPVKGQILTLRGAPAEPVTGRIVVSERVYLVPRADGRLIAGATVEEMGFDTRVTAGGVHELLREAYRALPDIAELELERVVAGLRPGTPDNAPIVGWGSIDGLLLATGHFRNGILLAPLTAEAVAALLSSESPPAAMAVADPKRFVEGTGPLTVVTEVSS
ncbi:MAG: glycine oxidase [Solirubrobacterales bacterium]|nr:glycine oxidase [Solirubrobacterales bacterium]